MISEDPVQAHVARLIEAGIKADNGWYPIEHAPWELKVMVGRWSDDCFIFCPSLQAHDPGNEMEGEAAYDYWTEDEDAIGVTDSEGPTVWQPLLGIPSRRSP